MNPFHHWKLMLGLLVVFSAGLIVGTVGTVRFVQKRHEARMNPDNWGPATLTWLRKELALTPEQETTLQPLVQDAVKDLVSLRDRAEQERRAILGRMLFQSMEHLTTEQQEKLRTLIEQHRRDKIENQPVPSKEK